jgi:hypothetical protein
MSELLRFQGKPIGPFDKCQSFLWIILFIYFAVTVGLALSYVGRRADDLLLQTTSQHSIAEAKYNISDVLGPLHLVSSFDSQPLLQKVR